MIGVNRAGVVTITLPTAEVRPGRSYTIKDESGAAATNNITVATEGSENIDGSATDVISTNFGAKSYYSDGANWFELPLLPTAAHASLHANGGSDAVKLDDLAAPDGQHRSGRIDQQTRPGAQSDQRRRLPEGRR